MTEEMSYVCAALYESESSPEFLKSLGCESESGLKSQVCEPQSCLECLRCESEVSLESPNVSHHLESLGCEFKLSHDSLGNELNHN